MKVKGNDRGESEQNRAKFLCKQFPGLSTLSMSLLAMAKVHAESTPRTVGHFLGWLHDPDLQYLTRRTMLLEYSTTASILRRCTGSLRWIGVICGGR